MSDTMTDDKKAIEEKPVKSAFTEEAAYQAVCKSAVAAVIFGVLGLSAFLAQMFMLLPILGIIFGLLALKAIYAYPDELVGKGAAKVGLILSIVCLVASGAMHSFIYATEVPEGYRRISFAELKPSSRAADPNRYPDRAEDFDGAKVFLKGYVRPPSGKQYGLKNFIMVGDFGDCCFGGNPKITEVVAVDITTDDLIDHSYFLRKIGGTFHLDSRSRRINEDGIPTVYYSIKADYIR